ncbi:MAG: tRNA (adenosine(37)-N6)-dimethylallyltransferase MiaA [Rhodospirillaceae bacterium]|nr:tRNA (adenosine(37)-N6)-dimethylallyltransferase MiaA [Rhodospirillaceae bacterium]
MWRGAMNDVEESPLKAVVVGGPTASGKSEVARQIAREFGGVVINADSMQVYQELQIVTARPDAAALAAVPHFLYGVLSARERCSAGRWRNMALAAARQALAAGQLPVLVGGTGLYLKALLEGIVEIPNIPEAVVSKTEAWLSVEGLDAGRHKLEEVDPGMARRLTVLDRQRLVRALSVAAHTGKPLSWWVAQPPTATGQSIKALKIAILPPRNLLHSRIDKRFVRMVENGAVDEVRQLMALELSPSLPAMKAVGVPQLSSYLKGSIDLPTAITRGQAATRQYSKRQFTWFRRQFHAPKIDFAQFSERNYNKIFTKICQFWLTG